MLCSFVFMFILFTFIPCSQTLKETLTYGVAFLHEGLSDTEVKIVEQLFVSGAVQVSEMSVVCITHSRVITHSSVFRVLYNFQPTCYVRIEKMIALAGILVTVVSARVFTPLVVHFVV